MTRVMRVINVSQAVIRFLRVTLSGWWVEEAPNIRWNSAAKNTSSEQLIREIRVIRVTAYTIILYIYVSTELVRRHVVYTYRRLELDLRMLLGRRRVVA